MSIDEIKNLDIKDRIILINTIWETLEKQSHEIKSPIWHQAVIE